MVSLNKQCKKEHVELLVIEFVRAGDEISVLRFLCRFITTVQLTAKLFFTDASTLLAAFIRKNIPKTFFPFNKRHGSKRQYINVTNTLRQPKKHCGRTKRNVNYSQFRDFELLLRLGFGNVTLSRGCLYASWGRDFP